MRRKTAVLLSRIDAVRSKGGLSAVLSTLWANLLILGINMLTGILTARLLAPAGRGELAAMTLWPQLIAYTLALGLPAALVYEVKRRPEQAHAFLGAALTIAAGMGFLATGIGLILIPLWLGHYAPDVIRFAQWMMLTAPIQLLGLILLAACQTRENFTLFNRIRYFSPALTLIALVILALFHWLDPFMATLAYLLAGIPLFVWNLLWAWRSYRPRLAGFGTRARQLASYAFRSSGSDLTIVLGNQIDRVVVVGLLSPAAMGLYVVANGLSRLLNSLTTPVTHVLMPKTAGRPKEEVLAITGRALRATLSLSLLIALPLGMLASWLLQLLYGEAFAAAAQAFRLLLAEAVISGMALVLTQAFLAVGSPGLVSLLQLVGLACSVPLLLALVPRYGIEGAGAALLLSTLLRFLFVYLSVSKVFRLPAPRMLPSWREAVGTMRLALEKRG